VFLRFGFISNPAIICGEGAMGKHEIGIQCNTVFKGLDGVIVVRLICQRDPEMEMIRLFPWGKRNCLFESGACLTV